MHIIEKVASTQGVKKVRDDTLMLTNANEILTKEGIRGKIAQVGKGFGTGRHTAFLASNKQG